MTQTLKTTLVAILLLVTLNSRGQNLIPNGSFESPAITYTEQLTTSGNFIYSSPCVRTSGGLDIDYWWVYSYYPERMINGTQPGCRDNDLAQDGTSYLMLQNSDNLIVDLLDTLEVGCLYQFTCYMNLETFRGTAANPSVMMFFLYNPDGNTIQSPIISYNLWQQFSYPFVATAASTRFEMVNWVFNSGLQIDNISIVKIGCPLPVVMIYCQAIPGNEIRWATASETNCSYFEVLRSIDLTGWTVVTRIEGSGNTTQPRYYAVSDAPGAAYSGTTYYVIRQVDYDGNTSYSKMMHVNMDTNLDNVSKFYKYDILGRQLRR